MQKAKSLILILDNLRSVHNVASIFRTGDCFGVSKIILIGTTPQPVDKFGKWRSDFIKVSLGAEKTVSWEYKKTITSSLNTLKKRGYKVYALEQDKSSKIFNKVIYPQNLALIIGNEPYGISKSLLQKVDTIIEIPQRGSKESLNVTIATGIAVCEILK